MFDPPLAIYDQSGDHNNRLEPLPNRHCHVTITSENSRFNFGPRHSWRLRHPDDQKEEDWRRSDFTPSLTNTWHDTTRTLTVRFAFV